MGRKSKDKLIIELELDGDKVVARSLTDVNKKVKDTGDQAKNSSKPVEKFTGALSKIDGNGKSAKKLGNISKSIKNTGRESKISELKVISFVGVLGGMVAGGVITQLVIEQAAAAKSALQWSNALGVSIETLTAWQFAGESAGLSAEKITDIFKDTAEKIGDAFRNNGGEAKEALDSLNLSIADMAKLSPDQQLLAIAGALGQVQTQGEKIQIMESLANDATLLLPLLDNDAKELRKLMDLANETGVTLTQIEAEKLVKVGEAARQVSAEFKGLTQQLTVEFSGALIETIKLVNTGAHAIGRLGGTITDGIGNEILEWWLRFNGSDINNGLEHRQQILDKLVKTQMRFEEFVYFGEEDKAARELILLKSIVKQASKLEQLRERIMSMQAPVITIDPPDTSPDVNGSSNDALQKELDGVTNSLLAQEDLIFQSYANRQLIVEEAYDSELVKYGERNELIRELQVGLETDITAIAEREANKRQAKEEQVQNKISGMRQNASGLAVGLLRTLSGHHKDYARAAVILEKGLAIARINKDAAVAHMGAETLWSLGPAAPAAIASAHAQIEGVRAVSIGLTAATGLAELHNINTGTDVSSTPYTPSANESSASSVTEPSSTNNNRTIQIYIEGSAYGDEDVRQLIIDAIKEAEANDEF